MYHRHHSLCAEYLPNHWLIDKLPGLSTLSLSLLLQFQGSPIMKYLEHTLDVSCKVNEFGTTCVKTLIDLSIYASSSFVSKQILELCMLI